MSQRRVTTKLLECYCFCMEPKKKEPGIRVCKCGNGHFIFSVDVCFCVLFRVLAFFFGSPKEKGLGRSRGRWGGETTQLFHVHYIYASLNLSIIHTRTCHQNLLLTNLQSTHTHKNSHVGHRFKSPLFPSIIYSLSSICLAL